MVKKCLQVHTIPLLSCVILFTMNDKVLKTLEYNKILDVLSQFAGSEPGKKMCLKLRPSTNIEWIDSAQEETEAALSRLIKNDRISFGSNKDIRGIIKEAQIGRTLSISDLLSIGRLLTLTEELSDYDAKDESEEEDALSRYFEELSPLPLLSKEITKCILSENEIADDASSKLKDIRRSYVNTEAKIHNQLTNMVSTTYRTYLMDAVITSRNGRYCIPVKAEYKNQVPGMVHDHSSSGRAIFIEPQAIVNLNNDLRELKLQEEEEIEIILKSLSSKCAAHAEEILTNQKNITSLDFIFAKGKYALKLNCTKPIFNADYRIKLRSARHPLLPQDKVVPIDVRLGEDFDLLVITGPNTGGKTVSLKTVGLLTLMGQSGLHIPTLDRSELSVFKEVFADIGDEQSIEQSLSTFSGHMTSIVNILKKASQDSLCLFDELGAGTDPSEGAALAISILSYLHDRGIRTMASTHYSELKIFALSTSYVENGSCEFDVESLRPTYKLLIGIPGKSNAFAISKKLGLSDEIIDNAKKYIDSEEESFENIISDLESKRVQIEKEKESIEAYKKEIESLKARLKDNEEKISEKRDKIIKDAREQAKDILQEAKDVADETIRAFQKQSTVMSIQTMEKKRSNVREKIKTQDAKLSEKNKVHKVNHPKSITMDQALPGTNVHIISMNLDGTITVRPDSSGNVLVQCGIISSKVNIKDLYMIEALPETKSVSAPKKLNISRTSNIKSEINVLGMTVDEAVSVVDKYLDDALLCHLASVRIVHGKGTGALRSGLHDFLSSHPAVRNYHLAAHGEGDAGVTIVEF